MTINDGFPGVAHTGLAYDGAGELYFAVAGNPLIPGSSQVWRLSTFTGLYTFIAGTNVFVGRHLMEWMGTDMACDESCRISPSTP